MVDWQMAFRWSFWPRDPGCTQVRTGVRGLGLCAHRLYVYQQTDRQKVDCFNLATFLGSGLDRLVDTAGHGTGADGLAYAELGTS